MLMPYSESGTPNALGVHCKTQHFMFTNRDSARFLLLYCWWSKCDEHHRTTAHLPQCTLTSTCWWLSSLCSRWPRMPCRNARSGRNQSNQATSARAQPDTAVVVEAAPLQVEVSSSAAGDCTTSRCSGTASHAKTTSLSRTGSRINRRWFTTGRHQNPTTSKPSRPRCMPNTSEVAYPSGRATTLRCQYRRCTCGSSAHCSSA